MRPCRRRTAGGRAVRLHFCLDEDVCELPAPEPLPDWLVVSLEPVLPEPVVLEPVLL